ncbi:uncharacterized protein LOC131875801 [Cryptomeria japonica]|uniref:uncharacterized protein LOC131875801 n=1 Tax=Cryptomeria japonica TaxID=3369 RepID=UPI0027DA72E7|nr:uncharacterized protein LOC131875801 [Cryptomeria japonica]
METVWVIIAIAAPHKWKVFQMDVKSTFFNGVLKEDVYGEKPPGYEVLGHEGKVYRLKKVCYGLKQAPRAWHNKTDSYLMSNGFGKSDGEPILYIKLANGKLIIVVLFMETPKDTHWQAGKRILRYVNGTKGYGILYNAVTDFRLIGYTYSDWARRLDDRKSTSGYVFHMGSSVISWASKKKPIIAISTVKAESKQQLADIFTKPLGRGTFERLRRNLGIVDLNFV